jgi:hypothetical protein
MGANLAILSARYIVPRFAGWLKSIYGHEGAPFSPLLRSSQTPFSYQECPQRDTLTNRYSYVYNRPLVYVDDSGHIPIIPIIVSIVVVASKVVDYGLTAYDAWQSGRVLANPNASRGDEVLPVGLPADDVARRALMKGAREAFEEGGEEALERFLRDALGDQADDVIERMFREVGEEGAQRAGQAYRFATGDKLMGHFRKHGAEFGYETAEQ